MPTFRDPVTLTNPDLPGVEVVKARRSVPFFAKAGWVEKKSPPRTGRTSSPAPSVDESITSPERDHQPLEGED